MVEDGTTTYRKYADSAASNNYLNNMLKKDYSDTDSRKLVNFLMNNKRQNNSRTYELDKELSDRLGIGRSNTLKRDNANPYDSYGSYDATSGVISVGNNAKGENGVSTIAHERLHSLQNENDIGRFDSRVLDAYKELSDSLKGFLKSDEELKEIYNSDVTNIGYWGNKEEQEARMLQQYLKNKGFVKDDALRAKEWGDEVNSAFDKFFNKLRELSKKGVALPAVAIASLFGLNKENDEESVDNIR